MKTMDGTQHVNAVRQRDQTPINPDPSPQPHPPRSRQSQCKTYRQPAKIQDQRDSGCTLLRACGDQTRELPENLEGLHPLYSYSPEKKLLVCLEKLRPEER